MSEDPKRTAFSSTLSCGSLGVFLTAELIHFLTGIKPRESWQWIETTSLSDGFFRSTPKSEHRVLTCLQERTERENTPGFDSLTKHWGQ